MKDIKWEFDELIDVLKKEGHTDEDIENLKMLFAVGDITNLFPIKFFSYDVPEDIVNNALKHKILVKDSNNDNCIRVTPFGIAWTYQCFYDESIISYTLFLEMIKGNLDVGGFNDGEIALRITDKGCKEFLKLTKEA